MIKNLIPQIYISQFTFYLSAVRQAMFNDVFSYLSKAISVGTVHLMRSYVRPAFSILMG